MQTNDTTTVANVPSELEELIALLTGLSHQAQTMWDTRTDYTEELLRAFSTEAPQLTASLRSGEAAAAMGRVLWGVGAIPLDATDADFYPAAGCSEALRVGRVLHEAACARHPGYYLLLALALGIHRELNPPAPPKPARPRPTRIPVTQG